MKKGKKVGKTILTGMILSAVCASSVFGASKLSPNIRMINANEDINDSNISSIETRDDSTFESPTTKDDRYIVKTTKDIEPIITLQDYQQKLENLNLKYAHMFTLKKEMQDLAEKQDMYYALHECYHQELKDLAQQLTGITPRNMWEVGPRIKRVRYEIVKNTDNTKQSKGNTQQQLDKTKEKENTTTKQNNTNNSTNNQISQNKEIKDKGWSNHPNYSLQQNNQSVRPSPMVESRQNSREFQDKNDSNVAKNQVQNRAQNQVVED